MMQLESNIGLAVSTDSRLLAFKELWRKRAVL
jgi:hypothetical protein